jgi:hypothetical protein
LLTTKPGADYIMGSKQAQMKDRAGFIGKTCFARKTSCRKFRRDGAPQMCVNGARCDLPHLAVLQWPATSSIMLHELVHLLEIRKDIRAKARVLATVAESEPHLAQRCEVLARRCKQLDGAIEAFVTATLETQAPQGHA